MVTAVLPEESAKAAHCGVRGSSSGSVFSSISATVGSPRLQNTFQVEGPPAVLEDRIDVVVRPALEADDPPAVLPCRPGLVPERDRALAADHEAAPLPLDGPGDGGAGGVGLAGALELGGTDHLVAERAAAAYLGAHGRDGADPDSDGDPCGQQPGEGVAGPPSSPTPTTGWPSGSRSRHGPRAGSCWSSRTTARATRTTST